MKEKWVFTLGSPAIGGGTNVIFEHAAKCVDKGIDVYTGSFPGGISLGLYILMNDWSGKHTKDHEWGHTRQSLRWGWLYLPTVGLVSITWCGLRNISKKLRSRDYYSIWPENNADKYGGVKRYE